MTLAVTATGGAGLQQAPSLRRRLACLLYEALLLFGVTLVSGFLGTLVMKLAGRPSSDEYHLIMQIVGVSVWAAYFVWFWTRRGQTLPMQTWGIKLVTSNGKHLGVGHALLRYAACAAWIAPAVLLAKLNHWSPGATMAAVGVNMVGYALLALLHPQRQFWHDVLCGTRLVTVPRPSAAST
ncbi:MAG TPA: RDD family protein [Rhizobacter sp.]